MTAEAPDPSTDAAPLADRVIGAPVLGLSVSGMLSALPGVVFGGVFLATWFFPHALHENMVSYLLLVMLMEFINVHSSGFMGSVLIGDAPRTKKSLSVLGLSAFYTLFVGGFALAFGVWWPVWTFWLMTGNRLLGLLIGQAPTGKEKEFVQYTWAAGVFFYVLFAFVTTLFPVPQFGITGDVVRDLDLPGGGLWIEEPQRVVAFGFLYFLSVAVSEMFGHAWFVRVRPTTTRA